MADEPQPLFVMMLCRHGAEAAIKQAFAQTLPEARFAYSRPGFLTFRIAENADDAPVFEPPSPLIRAWAYSAGKATAASEAERAAEVWRIAADYAVDAVHVFARDSGPTGDNGFEPGHDPQVPGAIAALKAANPAPAEEHADADQAADEESADNEAGDETSRVIRFGPARRDQVVLDVCLVEPDQWWIGVHEARRRAEMWPGGIPRLSPPADVVSRAWLKMREAIAWSGFPLTRGARVIDVGSAPGGASQALLDRGCQVIGIDPALPAEVVAEHERYTHLRGRARSVPRKPLRKCKWLVCDMNTAPVTTLDVVEDLAANDDIRIRGMLLTMKLASYELLADLPEWLTRMRGWGFNRVYARQLAYNRQEICIAASKRPFGKQR
jgi:23S rRNA (cytidine2498-2'-O)-methyltransferase